MKFKRLLMLIAIIMLALTIVSCAPKGINILEQNDDYVGEFYVPSSKKVEKGSALSIIAAINEGGYKVKTAIKTMSDDKSLIESYKLDCYNLNFEIFHYKEDSEKLNEIIKTGKYSIKNGEGTVLREFDATVNGNFVLFFSGTKDHEGNDRTEDNAKIIEIFKNQQLG